MILAILTMASEQPGGRLLLRLDHDIVDVGLDVLANLAPWTLLDAALVCGPSVLQSKGHGDIAECSEGSGKRSIDLIVLLHLDLVIA